MADTKPALPTWVPDWLKQLLDFTSAYQIDLFSAAWLVTTAVLAGLFWFFYSRKRELNKGADIPGKSVALAGGHAHVGQQFAGVGNTYNINNGNVTSQELLDRISAKDRELGAKDAQLMTLQNENSELVQNNLALQNLRLEAINTAGIEAAKPNPTKLASLAKQELLQGNIDATSRLLKQLATEQGNVGVAQLTQAAQYAKEDGALWMGRDVSKAIESFEIARGYQNEDLFTLDTLVRLYKTLGNSALALNYAQVMSLVAERQTASDPKNTDWQRACR